MSDAAPSCVSQRVVTGLPSGARSHAFLTVDGTLVSLYSGSKVTELSPAAVLSLLLLVHAVTPNAGQTGQSTGQSTSQSRPTQDRQVSRQVTGVSHRVSQQVSHAQRRADRSVNG